MDKDSGSVEGRIPRRRSYHRLRAARVHAANARDVAVDMREVAADTRDLAVDAREAASETREVALRHREHDLRDHGRELRGRSELDIALADRESLIHQMREANQQLVLATVHADELVELADAARQAASDNERRFRALATTAAAVIWRADAAGALHIDQDGWGAFTGIGGDDARWGWLQAISPDDRDLVRDTWTHARANATPYLCQHRLQTSSGELWVIARAVPIVVDGEVLEWIGTMTDITDSVRIDEAKEQFIGILGHDLRNPLSAIALGAEIFHDLPEPHGRVANQILRSVRRMQSMIRDMMDFTRGRLGGGIPVTKGPCNLGALARDVVAEMQQAYPARDLRCETLGDLDGLCDTDRVEQVISNLLGNAIAHGADPILLTVRDHHDEVVMTVHNRGTPIPVSLLPSIFEPFLRGHPAPARNPAGLGLGLYIVREIVQAHGGAIDITSTHDDGTTVTVHWPRGHAPLRPRLTA